MFIVHGQDNNLGEEWKSLIKEFVQFVLVRCLIWIEGCDGINKNNELILTDTNSGWFIFRKIGWIAPIHNAVVNHLISKNSNPSTSSSLYTHLIISMSEAIGNHIMNELKAIRKDIEFLKDHMVDIDCIMTEDDYLALNEYRTEKDSDDIVSHEDQRYPWNYNV